MEKKHKCCCGSKKEATKAENEQKYSGVAVNESNGEKVDADLVKERTATLNNNPRNDQ